jgi:hypothetical protein
MSPFCTIILAICYFGGILIVPIMLLFKPLRRVWRGLILLLLTHFILIATVAWLIHVMRSAGYRDWNFGFYYYVVVNFGMTVAYLIVALSALCK